MGIDQITGRIVDVLFIVTFLTALILLALTIRRLHLTITDVANGTGRGDLNELMADASANFRRAVTAQLEQVRDMMLGYRKRVQRSLESEHWLRLSTAQTVAVMRSDTLLGDQDDPWSALLTSLEPGPSKGAAAQLQALGKLAAQPRGATVTATFLRPDSPGDRLGIMVEVVSAARWWKRRRRVVWEPAGPAGQMALRERVDALIQPAARCAAVDLTAWLLLRRRSLAWLGRGRRREGLARIYAGMLMRASAVRFSRFYADFLRFAHEEFQASADLLPGDYQPHFNLATVSETEGMTAADHRRHNQFVSVVSEYLAAIHATESLPAAERSAVQRPILIRMIRAELISGSPQLRRQALAWLGEQRLRVESELRTRQPARRRPARTAVPAGFVLDEQAADSLYNSACMYAIAADVTGRSDWDTHARRLLGTALVVDAGKGDLWYQPGKDPDLERLSWHLPEFLACLRGALPEGPAQDVPLDEIVGLVDAAARHAGWRPAPAAEAHRGSPA